MKIQIIPLFIALSVSACSNTMLITDNMAQEQVALAEASKVKNQQPLLSYAPVERYSELLWVEQANPVSDALQALKQKDTKLWAYNTRIGPKIPGVDDDAVSTILQRYKLKMAAAMGDVVYGNEHLELRLKFIKYAKQYNQEILNSQ